MKTEDWETEEIFESFVEIEEMLKFLFDNNDEHNSKDEEEENV